MDEITRLINGDIRPPERIHGWLNNQMSIARFYGGLTYKNHRYVIDKTFVGHPEDVPLVRVDVLEREAKEAKVAAKAAKQANAEKQGALL